MVHHSKAVDINYTIREERTLSTFQFRCNFLGYRFFFFSFLFLLHAVVVVTLDAQKYPAILSFSSLLLFGSLSLSLSLVSLVLYVPLFIVPYGTFFLLFLWHQAHNPAKGPSSFLAYMVGNVWVLTCVSIYTTSIVCIKAVRLRV